MEVARVSAKIEPLTKLPFCFFSAFHGGRSRAFPSGDRYQLWLLCCTRLFQRLPARVRRK